MPAASNEGPAGYRVSECEVYPSLGRVVHGDTVIRLEPRAMDLLVFLVEHRGEVLSRDAIVDAVWTEQFVGEGVIRQAIAAIRRALGDDAREPRFIETIPKRGYRLIAEVQRLGAADEGTGGEAAPAEQAAGPVAVVGPEAPDVSDAVSEFECSLRFGRRSIRLGEGENIIGRSPEARIQIASDRVSRRHARILVAGGRATLEDLGSKNGTFLCGARIREPVELRDGEEIEIGRVILVFRGLRSARTATDRETSRAKGS